MPEIEILLGESNLKRFSPVLFYFLLMTDLLLGIELSDLKNGRTCVCSFMCCQYDGTSFFGAGKCVTGWLLAIKGICWVFPNYLDYLGYHGGNRC